MVVALDCSDAPALASFYARLLGRKIRLEDEDPHWVDVDPPEGEFSGFRIAYQQVADYQPPTWPDGPVPQQAHLDIYVPSTTEAEPIVLASGGRRHPHLPDSATLAGPDPSFVVYLDPAGHPFCLCRT